MVNILITMQLLFFGGVLHMSITTVPRFDNLNTPLIMTDSFGCIVYKNKAARKKYPRPSLGSSLVNLITSDTAQRFSDMLESGVPVVIRLREPESVTAYRAAAGPFVYDGIRYFMLVFIDTLHLDPTEILFTDIYDSMQLFWEKTVGILNTILEYPVAIKNTISRGRFRNRMNEMINVTAGQYIRGVIDRTDEGHITMKQLLGILNDAVDSVPARYDCKLRFSHDMLDDKSRCSISVDLTKYLSAFFLSLLPLLGISSDRYVIVSFHDDQKNGRLITYMRSRIAKTDEEYGMTDDFGLLAELFPNDSLNLCIFEAMSRFIGFRAEHMIAHCDGYSEITFMFSVRQITVNIMLLRSEEEIEPVDQQLASLPMELIYGILADSDDGC